MDTASLLIFCEIAVGLVFTWSSLAKLAQFRRFADAVRDFRLLPVALSVPAAACFLAGECLVVALLLAWPSAAFALATCLLTLFSIALAAVLLRGVQTPCNCFGQRKQTVSWLDVVRNGCFLLCSSGGWLAASAAAHPPISPWEIGALGLAALLYVMVWTHVRELYRLLIPE